MISVSEARKLAGWTPANAEEFSLALRDVITRFEADTRRLWARRVDHIQDIRGCLGSSTLFLNLYPVESGSLSMRRRVHHFDSYKDLTEGEHFVVNEENGVVVLDQRYPPEMLYEAVYTGGYETLPASLDDVKRALLLEVRRTLERDSDDSVAIQSKNLEGGSTTFTPIDNVHPAYRRAAFRYRKTARNF